MTFPGPDVALPRLDGVPAAIAGTPEALEVARRLVTDLRMQPVELNGDRRLYHAAAVVAGNFATVLIAEAARILVAAGVSHTDAPGMVVPLAIASLRNAATDPSTALTGPFARGDHATVASHRDALETAKLTEIRELYDVLAQRAFALAHAQDGEVTHKSD
jgi:predicted short-subunit dehydrogenase-like oxidoreductase (DUF2520 family)